MNKIVFLDYDGVVNTPKWKYNTEYKGWYCQFGHPDDGEVNNVDAVQWVSEFCEEYGFDIVVTSTWRYKKNYKECLINAGLRDSIKILGKTERLNTTRGEEIQKYLDSLEGETIYLIFDDEADMLQEQLPYLIKCDTFMGFTIKEYDKACDMVELRITTTK